MDSILESVKSLLGLMEENTFFDEQIKININSAIAILSQIGVGPKEGFVVTGKEDTYGDYLGENESVFSSNVKMYLYYRTKLGFDSTGLNSYMITQINNCIEELTCRFISQLAFMEKEGEKIQNDDG